jgi:hypothetical protein
LAHNLGRDALSTTKTATIPYRTAASHSPHRNGRSFATIFAVQAVLGKVGRCVKKIPWALQQRATGFPWIG